MRRLNLILLATLQLSGAGSAAGFSIHDDLLAFPQYEVVFSDNFISESDAQALLDRNADAPHPTYSAEFGHPTAHDAGKTETQQKGARHDTTGQGYTDIEYELINLSPHKYLCSIPILQASSSENQTENELAKAEQARELDRATANGWEMISKIGDSCLYFFSGWWSYQFCHNREIVQFHALGAPGNGQPPRRDPHTPEFVLGRTPAIPDTTTQKAREESGLEPFPAELQTKGDQRFLVQRLEEGTICDLTGKARTIEIQYHCIPGMSSDRIGWIKEVTTCKYLMAVHTPRLCDDVAFLPPEETKANPISCSLIVDGESGHPQLSDIPGLPQEASEILVQQEVTTAMDTRASPTSVTLGGMVVGARQILSGGDEEGKPPLTLPPPRKVKLDHMVTQDQIIDLVLQAASKDEGGGLQGLTDKELEELDLDPKDIESMKEKMRELAGDAGWKIEIVELPGGEYRELRGYIDGDEEEDDEGSGGNGGEEGSQETFAKKDEL